jgi:hypothetical protein
MSKCILRVAKITSQGSATGKTEHNYRLTQVPNANPQRKHLNQEYLNEGEKNIWVLATERIEQAGVKTPRKDAVRGMEFLITASPEAFQRDGAGMVQDDYRNTAWVADNLNFLKRTYGANLVAFTLHQDEKTPHIHAVVVPITADGRLSAKELFNPKTLKSLQTDYAKVMSKHGIERGIEGSRARHQTMKQIYGAQQQTQQGIENDLQPLQATNAPLTIDKPGALDLLNLERWRQQQEAKINAEYNRKLGEALKVAQKAQSIAMANATAAQQVKVLQQRLNTSEGLKQANYEKLLKAQKANTTLQADYDRVVVLTDENRVKKEWLTKLADAVRSKSLPQMEKDFRESLKDLESLAQFQERLQGKGYKFFPPADIRYVVHPETAVRIDLTRAQVDGQPLVTSIKAAITQTNERVRQEEIARAAKAAKKAQEEEATRKANQQKPTVAPKVGKTKGYTRSR